MFMVELLFKNNFFTVDKKTKKIIPINFEEKEKNQKLAELIHIKDTLVYELTNTSLKFFGNYSLFVDNYKKILDIIKKVTRKNIEFYIYNSDNGKFFLKDIFCSDYENNLKKMFTYINVFDNDRKYPSNKIIDIDINYNKNLLYKKIVESSKSDLNENGRRLYSSITLDEVPEKYRKNKLLGRGTTSLIYEYDDDNVLVITKDPFKYEWLSKIFGDEVKYIESIEPKIHKKYGKTIGERIDIFTMPDLLPLNSEDKRKVKKFMKKFYNEYYKKYYNVKKKGGFRDDNVVETLRKLSYDHEIKDFHNQIENLYEFLINYDPDSYVIDFQLKNFMKNKKGEIIFLDPIVDKKIIDFYYDLRRKKY